MIEEVTFRTGLDDHIGSLLDLIITDSKARVLDVKNKAALSSLSRCHSVLSWKFAEGRMRNEVFGQEEDGLRKLHWNVGRNFGY